MFYQLKLVLVKEGVIPRKVVHTEGKKYPEPAYSNIMEMVSFKSYLEHKNGTKDFYFDWVPK